MKRLRLAPLVLSLSLISITTMGMGSCGGAYHDAVIGEHSFSIVVKNFQDGEIALARKGQISPELHKQIEHQIEKVGLAGETLVKAMQTGASRDSVLGDFQAAATAVSDLQTNGVLAVKDPNAQATLVALMGAVQDLLANVGTLLKVPGATAPKALVPTGMILILGGN